VAVVSSVVDSWGKPGSGLLRFELTWMGRYNECTAASSTNISGKYCMVQFGKKVAYRLALMLKL